MKINNRETAWRVAGLFKFPSGTDLIAYASYDYLSTLLHTPNRAYAIRVVGEDHSPEA